MKPFPFLGHGEHRAKRVDLWQVLLDGGVRRLKLAQAPSDFESWPVLLVVWPGRVKASDWHRDSIHDARVLSALEKVVRSAPKYLTENDTPLRTGHADIAQALLATIKGKAPRAELVKATLQSLLTTTGSSRLVLGDALLERLPSLLGFDFDCDLVLRHHLAKLSDVAPALLPKTELFSNAMAERIRFSHGLASGVGPANGIDWSKAADVTAAITAESWLALAIALRESDEDHLQTLLTLSAEQLVLLAKNHDLLAVRIANAASLLLPEREFGDAIRLYDAALEGKLPAAAMSNPLFAIQDDNHHLGLDEVRARRYLERCVPFGDENPSVFLNAACVAMELDEPDRAIEFLTRAKKIGFPVRDYRSETLFEPLTRRADFIALMRR